MCCMLGNVWTFLCGKTESLSLWADEQSNSAHGNSRTPFPPRKKGNSWFLSSQNSRSEPLFCPLFALEWDFFFAKLAYLLNNNCVRQFPDYKRWMVHNPVKEKRRKKDFRKSIGQKQKAKYFFASPLCPSILPSYILPYFTGPPIP